nr:hypothetical protein [Nitrosospira multiformis]
MGESQTTEGDYHAFVSLDGEGMVDLNSLIDLPDGVILIRATGINNNGQVTATAGYRSQYARSSEEALSG